MVLKEMPTMTVLQATHVYRVGATNLGMIAITVGKIIPIHIVLVYQILRMKRVFGLQIIVNQVEFFLLVCVIVIILMEYSIQVL
mgnify:CR=1 FL=1